MMKLISRRAALLMAACIPLPALAASGRVALYKNPNYGLTSSILPLREMDGLPGL